MPGGSGRRRGARGGGTRPRRRPRSFRRPPHRRACSCRPRRGRPAGRFESFPASRESSPAGPGLSPAAPASDRAFVRFPLLAYLPVACGCVVAVGGAFAAVHRPLTALALLGAAALAAELIEEPESARVREPVGPGVFRVASGVDIAAVIVLGPWRGALVAGAAALIARLVRGSWRYAAFQASAFALAALAAGFPLTVPCSAHPNV